MYNIIEVANCHGGNKNYFLSLIDEFEKFNKKDNFGIKFQPFKYDEIATKDYSWYSVYEKLYFSEVEWSEIIDIAYNTKDIWLDLFDNYGLKILDKNKNKITGIKLQTSIIDNKLLYSKLKKIDLRNQMLILNIAGREVFEIEKILEKYLALDIKKIFLEIGFQGYPTELVDSGLSKLNELNKLKNKYKFGIVFADHIDGKKEDSIIYPVLASMLGVDIIEKHVMHSTLNTEYDFFSALTVKSYDKYIELQNKYILTLNQPFINKKERLYFEKTMQIPILKRSKNKGELININEDIEFKRTDINGITINELENFILGKYILNRNKNKGESFCREDFKKMNISAIVACRLKSTRLKRKALLKIGSLSSIELCLKNTLKFPELSNVVLATSTTNEDKELKNYVYSSGVLFFQGDPDDVIQRYIDIGEKLNVDIIVRITGDCPYISKDVYEFVLNSHLENASDYSVGIGAAVGTNIEIINMSALKEVKKYFYSAKHSEYMTWYFQNNPEIFNLNFVDLPSKWKRNYRLTLDYQEDLDMFNEVEKYFKKNRIEYTLDDLIKYLDSNPEVSNINSHLDLKYKTDQNLINLLNKETKIDIKSKLWGEVCHGGFQRLTK